MRKTTFIFALICCFAQQVYSQNDKESFQKYRERVLSDFQNFRKSILDDYEKFLGGEWKEREMFELLITVNGVGANTARMMLSGMSVAELCNAISTGNSRLIQSIKGIGKMTAQRIIVDLRDKIVALGIAEEIPAGGQMAAPVNSQVRDEAVSALTMLGFSPAPTQKVVLQILQEQPDLPVEQVVKLALKQIK